MDMFLGLTASHTSTVACVTAAMNAFVGTDGGTGEPTAGT
jgi:hypothetical protein